MKLEHAFARLPELSQHYVSAGDGEALVLLHGFPQTWYEWMPVLPELAKHYRVIMPDLRGLGASSRPAGGYDKDTMANDVWLLVNGELGFEHMRVVGHDWGGPVAYALAAQHRDAVTHLALVDVTVPGDGSNVFSTSQGRWHHAFHQTLDLPEALVQGREGLYISWFLDNFTAHPGAISDEAKAIYAHAYAQPGAMRAGFGLYRAIPADVENNTRHIDAGKLNMPTLGLGGSETFGRGDLVVESLKRVAHNVSGGTIHGSGHFIPEEAPDALLEALVPFLR